MNKEKQKLIPASRFPEFENDGEWKETKLSEVIELLSGYAFKSKLFSKNGKKLLTPKNFTSNGYASFTENNTKYTVEEADSKYICKEGDLMLLLTDLTPSCALLGKPLLITSKDVEVLLNQRIAKVITTSNIEVKFLLNFFLSESFHKRIKNTATGSTVRHTSNKIILNTTIFIPSIKEQQKIANCLSSLDNLIKAETEKLASLKDHKKGLLQQLFPANGETKPQYRFPEFENDGVWVDKMISDLANRFDNLRKPVTASNRIKGTTPYYGANGIQSYIEGYTHNGEFILVAEDGANDLQNYPVQYASGKIWVNNHAHVLQGKIDICNNLFLMYAIQNANIEPYLVGGGRAKLNANIMMKINFLVPELLEQQKIANCLTSADNLIEEQTSKIEGLKEHQKGLMQQLFPNSI